MTRTLVTLATLAALAACAKSPASKLTAADRDAAVAAAQQCTDGADSLAPSFQAVGPKLSSALELDRAEAQRLLRDSIELLIATRELLCNVTQAPIDHALSIDANDREVIAALTRVQAARERLGKVRTAYDALLGATSANAAPVDQEKLLERMQHALLGN